MKNFLFPVLLFSQICLSQNFIFKSDTIKTSYNGSIENALKFKNNFYFFTQTENNGYSDVETLHFYKMDFLGKTNKIKVPKDLKNVYRDLYSQGNSLFTVNYWDKTTFLLNEDKNEWVKTNLAEDIIFEDKEYIIYSIDLGEFGGYTWFKNKTTKKEFGIKEFFYVATKFNNKFILIYDNGIIEVKNPEYLNKAIFNYPNFSGENDKTSGAIEKVINSKFSYKEFKILYQGKFSKNSGIVLFTSFVADDNLYFLYSKNEQPTIGKLVNNKLEDIYYFDKAFKLFRYYEDYRMPSNLGIQNVQFRTSNEYLNGIIEIKNNEISTYFIKNLNETPIIQSSHAIDWFKESFTFYSDNIKKLDYKEVENYEKQIKSFPILTGNGLNTYRTQEVNHLVLTKEYYFSVETNKLKHLTFFWDFDSKLEFKYAQEEIAKITDEKSQSLIEFLSEKFGKPTQYKSLKIMNRLTHGLLMIKL